MLEASVENPWLQSDPLIASFVAINRKKHTGAPELLSGHANRHLFP
jgi:hypothetical protein